MRGNAANMGDVNCISRKPNQKGFNTYFTKPFKDASAELRMLLQPLSLFPGDPKDLFKEKKNEKTEDHSDHHYRHGLVECIGKQLQWQQDNQHLSPEEQEELIAVLLHEVTKIEPYITEQINNPSLNEMQQRKLSSTLHQIVLQICEKLYLHYCDKAQVLTARGIFSGTANICRLRTQLTMDAENILSVQGLKRVFVNMKDPTMEDSLDITDEGIRTVQRHADSGESSEISEIIKQMPSINLEGLLPACLYTLSQANKHIKSPDIETPRDQTVADDFNESFQTECLEHSTFNRRCNSVPNISYGDTILDEFDLETPKLNRCHSLGNQQFFAKFFTEFDWEEPCEMYRVSTLQRSRSISLVNQDLMTLIKNRRDDRDLESVVSDDMPPLIKAVPQYDKRKKAREKLDKQIQELYEKEKAFQEKSSTDLLVAAFDQPTVLTKKLAVQTAAVRVSDVRVSKRFKFVDHHLISKAPQYNDLLGEINSEGVRELDKPLFEEKELKKVYSRFLDPMGHGDKYFDNDTTYNDVPKDLVVNMKRTLWNESLCQFDKPPWAKMNYNDWLLQPNKMKVLTDATKIYPMIPDYTPLNKNTDSREVSYWKKWWRTIITPRDFLKYLCLTESDFLGAVFHLFENKPLTPEIEEKLKGDKMSSEHTLKSKKTAKGEKGEKGDLETSEEASPEPIDIAIFQQRLNKMWDALQMPEDQRIELAIKYATDADPDQFEMKLDAWEEATELIIQRETLMAQLMTFESEASDPNRFFLRGAGNANHRLQEAKTRSTLYNKIEHLGKKITREANMIYSKYEEICAFQGRPYLEKMKWDRIEMLHWLQEVRKTNALHYESKKLHTHLPQMSFKQLVLTDTFISK